MLPVPAAVNGHRLNLSLFKQLLDSQVVIFVPLFIELAIVDRHNFSQIVMVLMLVVETTKVCLPQESLLAPSRVLFSAVEPLWSGTRLLRRAIQVCRVWPMCGLLLVGPVGSGLSQQLGMRLQEAGDDLISRVRCIRLRRFLGCAERLLSRGMA
jgi:hypothetical protein